jgi:hypothetical protein
VGGIAILTLLLSVASPSPEELQRQAEAAFREGAQLVADPKQSARAREAFSRSAGLYYQIAESGHRNPALYRNLGNAALLADDLPQAILAYRRGLRLAPNDLQLRENLAHARAQVAHPPTGSFGRPPVENRPPWLPRLPEATTGVVFGLYGLGCLALVRWWMVRRPAWRTTAAVAFAGAALVAAGLAWQSWDDRQEELRPLVVIAVDDVVLRRGNGRSYPPRYPTPLKRGVEARRLFDRGDWLQIELSGGEVGWVERATVLEAN